METKKNKNQAWIAIIAFIIGAILFSGSPEVENKIVCKYNEEDVEQLLSIDDKVFTYAGDIITIFADAILSTDIDQIENATEEIEEITSELEVKRVQRSNLLEKMNLK